jgi:predicted acyltransferase
VLLGVLAGRVLQRRELASRLGWLAGCGVGLATLGLMWNTVFPINKRMWTSSYVLWVAAIDFLLLALLSRWLDRPAPPATGWRQRLLTPWQAFGSNALVAYVLSEIIAIAISTAHVTAGVSLQRWSYLLIPAWAGPPPLRSLVWSVAFTALCYLPVHLLYRKRIFIKL